MTRDTESPKIVNADYRNVIWPEPRDGKRILLTDPPYGLSDSSWKRRWHGNNGRSTLRNGRAPDWDCRVELGALIKWADIAVICGGNFYHLPPSPCWFVWDKLQSNRGSDAELIWTNAPIRGVKVFRMSRIDAYFNKRRWPKKHPAEKPIQLWAWILAHCAAPGDTVFDPFMGTGSSAVAAKEAGCKYLGVEVNSGYFDEANRRIA